ncbi:MAG: DUF99 family protein [Candidatus Hydrothermarchaeaceae archaeon]
MRIHADKKGLRALGIAESFRKGEGERAVLAGVVMRGDLQIDGFALTTITVGGLDGTDGVLDIFEKLDRTDINVVLLNGCVISLFNLVDIFTVCDKIDIPVICVTYEESEGLEKYFAEFDDCDERMEIYERLGERMPVKLHTGHEVLVRCAGIEEERDVRALLDRFTLQGAIPEPLKVARLLARSVYKNFLSPWST